MAINLDHFRYHAPTGETSPKYAAIRDAERVCHELVGSLYSSEYFPATEHYERINATLLTFAQSIDANAPDSADKTAAIRCVRLARNAMNEHLTCCLSGTPVRMNMLSEATRQLVLARFQANSAIACGGK